MPALIQIEKFIGGLHLDSTTSNLQMDPSDCLAATNVEYYPRGTISRREGYQSLNMTGDPLTGVMNVFPWKDSTNSNVTLVYTSTSGANVSGDVYTISLAGTTLTPTKVFSAHKYGSTVWSPNLTSDQVHVASYGGSALAVYGGNAFPLIYASTPGCALPCSGATVTTSPPSGAKYICAWGNYVFVANHLVGGTRKYSRVQWNSNGSIYDWPSSYYIDLDSDDGDEITGMCLLHDYLVVFKKKKIFMIYWVGGTLLFKEARRSSTIGTISGRSVVENEGKLYFVASDGAYTFDGTTVKEISKKVKSIFTENLVQNRARCINAGKYRPHRQIWFAYPDTAGWAASLADDYQTADRVLVYDWELDNWCQYTLSLTYFGPMVNANDELYSSLTSSYSTYNRTIASFAGAESEMYIMGHANYDNTVYKNCLSWFGGSDSDKVYTSGSSTLGSKISSEWKSIWFDQGEPNINKRFTRVVTIADAKASTTSAAVTLEVRENWESNYYTDRDGNASQYSLSLTGSNTSLPKELRTDNSRTARAFQFLYTQTASGQPWTIHKLLVEGRTAGRTKV